MGILNRIVSVLVLVLAIGAGGLSFMLAEKRKNLLNRGDELAKTVNEIAKVLDKDGGTSIHKEVTPERLNDYNEAFPANMGKLVNQAKDVATQRAALSAALLDIATIFEEDRGFDVDGFQGIGTYAAKIGELKDSLGKVRTRRNNLISEVVAIANKHDVNIIADNLKGDALRDAFAPFATKIDDIDARRNAFMQHISRTSDLLDIRTPPLQGADYVANLDSHRNEVVSFRGMFDQTKTDLDNTKNDLQDSIRKLDQSLADITRLNDSIGAFEREIEHIADKLKEPVASELMALFNSSKPEDFDERGARELLAFVEEILKGGAPRGKTKDDVEGSRILEPFLRQLRGTVIGVDRKWDFVVIDLPRATQMTRTNQDGTQVSLEVNLPMGRELVVARTQDGAPEQFVGRVKLVEAYDVCSIGNVLPSPKSQAIQVGDLVYFDFLEKGVKEEIVDPLKEAPAEEDEGGLEEVGQVPAAAAPAAVVDDEDAANVGGEAGGGEAWDGGGDW